MIMERGKLKAQISRDTWAQIREKIEERFKGKLPKREINMEQGPNETKKLRSNFLVIDGHGTPNHGDPKACLIYG